MTKMIKNTFLLLSLTMSCLLLPAQAKLTVDSAWTLPADTVEYNGNIYIAEFTLVIENIGNALLNGGFDVMMIYPEDTSRQAFVMGTFEPNGLEVGEQFQCSFKDTIFNISGNRYKGGDNILVIWPKAEHSIVQDPDTAYVHLWIKDIRSSVKDQNTLLRSRVTVYPNPANDVLKFQFLKDQNKLEYVRIVSLEGKELFRSNQVLHEIPMHTLPTGTFLLEMKYTDGLRGTLKIVHE